MTDSTPTARRMVDGRMVDVPMAAAEAIHRPAAAELARGDLLDALERGAGVIVRMPAHLEVLCMGAFGELVEHPRVLRHIAVDAGGAHVDWSALAGELNLARRNGGELVSAGGDAMLLIACSLAGHASVNLATALGRLDSGNRRVVLQAMFTATGQAGEVWSAR